MTAPKNIPAFLQLDVIAAHFIAMGRKVSTAKLYARNIRAAFKAVHWRTDPEAINTIYACTDTDTPKGKRLESVWLKWQEAEPQAPRWPDARHAPAWAAFAAALHEAGLSYSEIASRRWVHIRVGKPEEAFWYIERARVGLLVPFNKALVVSMWRKDYAIDADTPVFTSHTGGEATEAEIKNAITAHRSS